MNGFQNILKDYLRIDIFEAKFTPVERIVYGTVALILTSFMLSLIYLVIK